MIKVKLDIKNVGLFIVEACKFEGDVDVISGKYVVNGKSLMGLYSLDMSKDLDVDLSGLNELERSQFIATLKELNILAE